MPFLLFTNRIDIRRLSLTSSLQVTSQGAHQLYTTLVRDIPNAIALDYSLRDGVIFWTDLDLRHVMRATLNGSEAQVLVTTGLEKPGGLATDWIHRKLFWTDAGRARVEVSDFEGRMRRTIVHQDIDKPRAIAVHPTLG